MTTMAATSWPGYEHFKMKGYSHVLNRIRSPFWQIMHVIKPVNSTLLLLSFLCFFFWLPVPHNYLQFRYSAVKLANLPKQFPRPKFNATPLNIKHSWWLCSRKAQELELEISWIWNKSGKHLHTQTFTHSWYSYIKLHRRFANIWINK